MRSRAEAGGDVPYRPTELLTHEVANAEGRGEVMRKVSRREFLVGGSVAAAIAAGGVGCAASNPSGTAGGGPSGSISPGSGTTPKPGGSLRDVEHVVIFLQENRSFDHYFGTRANVRGFGDTNVIDTFQGKPVWYQPYDKNPDGYLLPFRLDTATTSGACGPDPDHSWIGQHIAWNGGKNDGFAGFMGQQSLGYFTRADLPYYYALADNFTVCDQYFCSVLGPTNPNRHYSMSATIDPAGTAGGPAIANGTGPFNWTTYPQRLSQAGITWRVYHEVDDYDDNMLKYFGAFQGLAESDPLYDNAIRNRAADAFMLDAAAGNLPQVSWIVAPEAKSEHPSASPAFGEDLSRRVLASLMGNAKLWAKTVFVLSYDENGGFFDHVPPPTPPPGTPDEYVNGQAIGLGFRVPTIIVSPWSRGGRVNSDVFDHTSTLRFLEQRFGVEVPNLSAWRRETCGDLTSTLDFSTSDTTVPVLPETQARVDAVKDTCGPLPPAVPPTPQVMPTVEA